MWETEIHSFYHLTHDLKSPYFILAPTNKKKLRIKLEKHEVGCAAELVFLGKHVVGGVGTTRMMGGNRQKKS